jgi:hypothetical protein
VRLLSHFLAFAILADSGETSGTAGGRGAARFTVRGRA